MFHFHEDTPALFLLPLQFLTTGTLCDPGAAGQDTSCLDGHNGPSASHIQKSLEILVSTLSMFSADISLEGSYIKNEMHLIQVCQVLLQSIFVFLQNLPTGSQDIFSLLLQKLSLCVVSPPCTHSKVRG